MLLRESLSWGAASSLIVMVVCEIEGREAGARRVGQLPGEILK
jgi:hypothetical protein